MRRLRFDAPGRDFLLASLSSRPVIILFSGWLAALGLVAFLIVAGRDVAFERTLRSVATFSTIVQENTARSLHAVDITLGTIADAYKLSPPLPRHDVAFRALLTKRLKALPDVRAIFVVGADGSIQHDTDHPATPDVSLADRAYFQAHAADRSLERSVSMPILSRSGTGHFIAVTHRLGDGSRFEGILVAAMQADRFDALFGRIGMDDGDVVVLMHRSGQVVARFPSGSIEVGASYANLPLFTDHLPQREAGTFVTTRSITPGRRVVSYQVVEDTPLLVCVSRSLDAAFAAWRRTAIAAVVAMIALTLSLSAFIAHLVRAAREQERDRLRHAQAEKLETLGQLTGGIAHDFGNIVHIISMNIELLRRLAPSDSRRSIALDTAQHATTRASELISSLLAFARHQPMERVACDLNERLAASRELLIQAAGSGIQVTTELGTGLPRVICDPSQLDIALVNLVLNASQAMAGAGRTVLRTFRCRDGDVPSMGQSWQARRPVCLSVEDSGSGMTESVRRNALEPFFTTKGTSGTGLGLAQVYGFMQQIGGDLRIESTLGLGTTVLLYFCPAESDTTPAARR